MQDAPSDDVEFLYERRNSFSCQMCGKDLTILGEQQRTAHYDAHFSNKAEGPSSTAQKSKLSPLKPKDNSKRKRKVSASEDKFWHTGQDDTPPPNFTPGLIPLLKKALMKAHAKGAVEKAYLCSDVAVHIGTESFDRGWGCGYRNFLMASAALMSQQSQPLYFPLLDAPIHPGVRNLQEWIEDAWTQGFDEEGRSQLKKLAKTTKWIGTAELYVAFTSRGVPANLVDFVLHDRDMEPIIRWIVDYFTQDAPKSTNVNDALKAASPVVITNKMPIVLQHSGHSRTVVGYERLGSKIQLLMFDPSRGVPQEIRRAALALRDGSTAASPAPQKHHLSPKTFFRQVLRPHASNGSSSRGDEGQAKRLRAGNDDVIVIDSDDELPEPNRHAEPKAEIVDLTKVLKSFRVASSSLKKDKYQILYFPMTAPLTDSERAQRKVVTSKKIS
ncbi:peptidase family C78-domain-containing protein [Phanerochaete sordida]|uniref:Peptidase family C78-domain-containing protein n=1 Tax=Phanerochaete sordida TaxID=48140 RepID=A0A9P3G2C2_9APHY|nr:peptidase family C78-domain-containing protein [Phanerochaete sordida]